MSNAKSKPRIPAQLFVETFVSSKSAQEVADKLGLTLNSVYLRAKSLRAKGVKLADGFERKATDVSGLNEFIEKCLAERNATKVESDEKAAS